MKSIITVSLLILFLVGLNSCLTNKDESTLNSNDIRFIQNLGILHENEDIEIFESNGGFEGIKQSGNFITSNRIASYWIEDDQKEIESAYFSNEIDSITFTDLISKLTYASYVTVYKTNGQNFNVYVDADSTRTYQFFNKAQNNWMKYRTNK